MAFMRKPVPRDVTTLRPEDVIRLQKEIEEGLALLNGQQTEEGDSKPVELGGHPDEDASDDTGAIIAAIIGGILLILAVAFLCMDRKNNGSPAVSGHRGNSVPTSTPGRNDGGPRLALDESKSVLRAGAKSGRDFTNVTDII